MALRYRLPEAAEQLRISLTAITTLVNDGKITTHQDSPGGHRFVSQESLKAYISDREESGCVGKRRVG